MKAELERELRIFVPREPDVVLILVTPRNLPWICELFKGTMVASPDGVGEKLHVRKGRGRNTNTLVVDLDAYLEVKQLRVNATTFNWFAMEIHEKEAVNKLYEEAQDG